MSTPPKLTKLQAMRRFKAAPQSEIFRMMWDMQEAMPRLIAEHFKGLKNEALKDVAQEGSKLLQELIDEHVPGLVDKSIKARVGELKKGKDGDSPVRGKDFWTREDKKEIVRAVMDILMKRIPKVIHGKDAKPLKAGVDYPTKGQMRKAVSELINERMEAMGPGEIIEAEEVREIAHACAYEFDADANAAAIARALEGLKDKERLDYNALKNRPEQSVKMYDENEPKLLARHRGGGTTGGGVTPLAFDLSDQLDGVAKIFTIPSNTRVLGVFGTQFPVSYRPLIDWTSTTTELTLTAEVAAPEAGQTLWILYVPV